MNIKLKYLLFNIIQYDIIIQEKEDTVLDLKFTNVNYFLIMYLMKYFISEIYLKYLLFNIIQYDIIIQEKEDTVLDLNFTNVNYFLIMYLMK